ncbi:tetratricopeptide repeat protein [Tumebacillus sp. ITR2]|uniref:Tetratricopeptide repeat protein n=1 Tax=Tumebacillus amylolyticus TaxID=2801339 RepID=A0ABS1JGT0_9BACL|nr:toll/interleukin-1 receptor domain-containing protein [Tumebacillus amylolyticus]MBL0389498.1 tetratricopeptide repeat protein [Tumebacillus amylolyticus]
MISYNRQDEQWALVINRALKKQGYSTIMQKQDFKAGGNFVLQMHKAVQEAERVLLVLSQCFLDSVYTQPEWAAFFADDPQGEKGLIVPVKIGKCDPQGLLKTLVHIDLTSFSISEYQAMDVLVRELAHISPTLLPEKQSVVWSMQYDRNELFVGRDEVVEGLFREEFDSSKNSPVIRVLTGLGGIGKTQIALEYAYRARERASYGLFAWIQAEDSASLHNGFRRLAEKLGLHFQDEQNMLDTLKQALETRSDWLLILDNAEDLTQLQGYLPQQGGGHILVTSQNPIWRGKSVELDFMEDASSVELLLRRANLMEKQGGSLYDEALELVRLLGNLPLAVEQAGAYIEAAEITIREYMERFRAYKIEVFTNEEFNSNQKTVATTLELSLKRIQEKMPIAKDIMELCSYLAPDEIQLEMLVNGRAALPEPLTQLLGNSLQLDKFRTVLRRYSLIRYDKSSGAFSIHRLTQLVIREMQTCGEKLYWVKYAYRLMEAVFQFDKAESVSWKGIQSLLSHVDSVTGHARQLKVDLDRVGDLADQAGILYRELGLYRQAEEELMKGYEMRVEVYGECSEPVSLAANHIGSLMHEQGKFSEAERWYLRALQIWKALFGEQDIELSTIYNNLAGVYLKQGLYEEAERCFLHILGPNPASVEVDIDDPVVWMGFNNFAELLQKKGDRKKAEEYFLHAYRYTQKYFGEKNPHFITVCSNLGLLYADNKDFAQGEFYLLRAIEIGEELFGPSHVKVGRDVNNLGYLLYRKGEYDQALHCFNRALAVYKEGLEPDNPELASVLNNHGLIMEAKKELHKAINYYQQALEINEKSYGHWHPKVAANLLNIGIAYFYMGDLSKSLEMLLDTMNIEEKVFGVEHPELEHVYSGLIAVYSKMGNTTCAVVYHRKVLALRVKYGN